MGSDPGTGTPAVTTTVNVTMAVQSPALTPVKSESNNRVRRQTDQNGSWDQAFLSAKWQDAGLVATGRGQRRLSRY